MKYLGVKKLLDGYHYLTTLIQVPLKDWDILISYLLESRKICQDVYKLYNYCLLAVVFHFSYNLLSL